MAKLSQCSRCVIGDGNQCKHYQFRENEECPHFCERTDNEIDFKLILELWSIMMLVIGLFINNIALLIGTILFIAVAYLLNPIIKHYKSNYYPYKEMRNLIIETLKQIGCQPEIDKENKGHVNFMYQGEHFFISIENDTLVTFYNTWWGNIELDNPDIDNLKEAINQTNMGSLPKVVYTTYQEDNKLGVHTMYRLFLKKEIPDLPNLFKVILITFFDVQKEVKGRFAQLNNEKVEAQTKERVKIKGFNVE